MKLIKFLVGTVAIAIIPVCAVVMADDCFDTVVDDDGKVYYIDPFDKLSGSEDKKVLLSIYGDKIKCTGEKKVYTTEEYREKINEDLYKEKQKTKSESSGGGSLIELVMLILSCVAMWKIFVKAGKPGINSIIPIYNFYELSDIAGLQGMFWKVLLCGIAGIGLFLFVQALGIILMLLCAIYGFVVNFYVARNFGWSTLASVLYVIFNPIAMLILAFGNDKYYLTEQKEKMKEISRKVQLEENLSNDYGSDNNIMSEGEIEDSDITEPETTPQSEDPIKYIDPSQFK